MATSLIRAGHVVVRAGTDADSTTMITDGAIYQRDGLIEDVGSYDDLKARHAADVEIGGRQFIAIPGLVNCHHHGRGVTAFQMGNCDDSLETWIVSGWGKRPYDQYLMTAYTAMQMIESGTTTIMYNHPQSPVATLEQDIGQILKAFGDSGMRTAYSLYYRDQNRVVYGDDDSFISSLPPSLGDSLGKYLAGSRMSADDHFAFFERTYAEYGKDPNGRVRVLLSPSNVQWASDDFLQRAKQYAVRYNTGIHMHLVESYYQKEYGLRTWGKTPLAHLNDLEFLGPEVSFAHGVWLTEGDLDLLAQTGATVCHNVSSNLRLKSGVAPVNRMLSQGVNVAMGTDSNGINDDDDILQEMRLVAKIHREPGIESTAINSHQVLRMATINAALPTMFQDQIGALEVGRRADVVLVDIDAIRAPFMDADINPVDALMYRGKPKHVNTVIIDGEVVLQDGRFAHLDKEGITQGLKDGFSGDQPSFVGDTRNLVEELLPHIQRFYQGWDSGKADPQYRYNSGG